MTTEHLPEPLTPADCDLRKFDYLPLEVARLRDSDLATVPDAEAFRANVLSWCVSWHQVPAGSLPSDDAVLARLLGYGRDVKSWLKVKKAGGLRGWVLCNDGRLYHPVVAEKAIEAAGKKTKFNDQTRGAREALKRKREQEKLQRQSNGSSQSSLQTEFPSVEPSVTDHKRIEEKGKKESTHHPSSLDPARPDLSTRAGDADLVSKAGALQAKLETMLNLGTPVILAPIVQWMQAGATPELIEATIADAMAKKPAGWKPSTIGYFTNSVRDAIANGAAPKSRRNGEVPIATKTQSEVDEIERINARFIADGSYQSDVSLSQVKAMIGKGLLTAEDARKAGYAA